MPEKYFHTGEFAALSGVSKDTLFYYDRIGLLKPDTVAKNGYRCYSLNQFQVLDTILTLKKIGTPLREIREYMGRQSSSGFLSLLRQKQQELDIQLHYLERLRGQMEKTAAVVENALTVPRGELLFEQQPEAVLLITRRGKGDPERSFLLAMREHIAACQELGAHEFPLGEIVPPEEIAAGRFREQAYFSWLDEVPEGCSRAFRRSAGEYAVLYHEGGYDSLSEAYRRFTGQVEAAGCRLTGAIYEEDQINMLGAADETRYLLKILAPVRRVAGQEG